MTKNELPVVHCIYRDTEKSLLEILEESFRLYLSRNLQLWRNLLYSINDE